MTLLDHLLGTCGENHPNLITITLIVGLVLVFFKKLEEGKSK